MSRQFIPGLRIFPPKGKTPDFIKFNGILTKKELMDFLETVDSDELRFQVKESKKGGYYVEIDTWNPDTAEPPKDLFVRPMDTGSNFVGAVPTDDLPF